MNALLKGPRHSSYLGNVVSSMPPSPLKQPWAPKWPYPSSHENGLHPRHTSLLLLFLQPLLPACTFTHFFVCPPSLCPTFASFFLDLDPPPSASLIGFNVPIVRPEVTLSGDCCLFPFIPDLVSLWAPAHSLDCPLNNLRITPRLLFCFL